MGIDAEDDDPRFELVDDVSNFSGFVDGHVTRARSGHVGREFRVPGFHTFLSYLKTFEKI
jgi:hypothetical protein